MLTCTFEDGGTALLRHAVVDCLVIKDDKILLGKRAAKLVEGGKWNLMAGYMDRDETSEEAARREVMEESGWEIENLHLLRIDDRPDRRNDERQNVAFTYVAEATRQTGEGDWENDELRWFALDQLPPEEVIAFDHADIIELYKAYLQRPFALPVIGMGAPAKQS